MIHVVLPGRLDRPTGGSVYDRRMVEGLRALGREVAVHPLAESFPHPSAADLAQAEAVLAGLPDGALVVVDGLALGVLPETAARHAGRLRLVALVHHPLAEETGLDRATADAFRASERAVLALVRRVVVTSPSTKGTLLRDYGVHLDDVSVVVPGTDPAPPAEGSGGPGLALLSVGALVPRKGHDVLAKALMPLADRPWRLTIAGPERDPATAALLKSLIENAGLGGRIRLAGAVSDEDLAALYHRADLFVLASHHEGYGMVLSEAAARGLPIVSTTGGAIPATVPAGAGVLVPPGDVDALSRTLARLMDAPDELAVLRGRAMEARGRLPDWPAQAAAFASVLEGVR